MIVTDRFEFESPFGIVGKLFNTLVLKNYMKTFLLERNAVIREFAESGKWKRLIS